MDKISSKSLKDGAEVSALPLCNLVNLSMKLSLFSDQYQIAKLNPVFKKGSKNDLKTYRPISLLPVLFKIIEKTTRILTQKYLDKNGLLYKCQSSFRANFLTNSCLVQLTNYILWRTDKGFHTRMILVNLQVAFGTLAHTVLKKKMECLGFKESVIKWFQSYLSNRKFFVTLENVFSDARTSSRKF